MACNASLWFLLIGTQAPVCSIALSVWKIVKVQASISDSVKSAQESPSPLAEDGLSASNDLNGEVYSAMKKACAWSGVTE